MKEGYFRFSSGICIDGDYYFSNIEYNALYVWENNAELPRFIAHFPDEPFNIFMLHKSCIRYENKLIFIPKSGQHFHIYDLNTGTIIGLKLSRRRWDIEPISESVWIGNMLYAFPTTFDEPVFVLNPVLEKVNENWVVSEWGKNNIKTNEILKMCRLALYNDKIYISIYNSDNVLIVNKRNMDCSLKRLNGLRLFAAFGAREGVFLITNNDDSLYYLSDGRELETIKVATLKSNKRVYNHVINIDEKIILIPIESTIIEIIDESGESKNINAETYVIDKNMPFYFGYSRLENGFIMYPFNTKELVKVDVDELLIEKKSMVKDIYNYSAIPHKSMISECEVNMENTSLELSDFIDYVIS